MTKEEGKVVSHPSKAYWGALEMAKNHHITSKTFSGKFLKRYLVELGAIIKEYRCHTVLDLGCGKASIYKELDLEKEWGVTVTKYDPAVPEFEKEPEGKFDLVICTHVLGSIPIVDLGWFIDRMYGFANRAVYVAERVSHGRKDWCDITESCPVGWTAVRWLDELSPRRPEGIDLLFTVVYPRPEGLLYGRFKIP